MHLSQWSRRSFALTAAFLVGIGLVASTSQEASARRHHRNRHHVSRNSMSAVAARTPELKTTMEAYKKAGMVGHLNRGMHTVFMPSDAGWGKMAKENREGLMNDPKKLQEVLKYHMVKGSMTAADLGAKRSVVTMQGESLMLDNKDGTVIVDGCVTTTPDVKTDNGMIQIIDYIPIPERGR